MGTHLEAPSERLHFLAGLPRSGSTLLANILCQNPLMVATATSGIIDLLAALIMAWENNPTMVSSSRAEMNALLHAVLSHKYQSGKVYIDKSRGWVRPGIMETMADVLGRAPKIIATVRPVPDCVASFARLIKPDDMDGFCKNHPVMEHLRFSYESLNAGYKKYPENILFVEYDNLMVDPQHELNRIYDFLGLPRYSHCFEQIESIAVEDDEKAWGISDLHTIRPKLQKVSPDAVEVLGEKLSAYFDVPECWNPGKPSPPKINLLDSALECALRGDFVNAEAFVDMALALNANDNRAKFNKGWYELAKGSLNKGMRLLTYGRNENIFGNPAPSGMPLWEGQDLHGKTVLLNLEGGLGDQICNARFATDLSRRGASVVLGGAAELATTLMRIDGVVAYAESGCAGGVYHDYWVPSMSAALLLGLEYQDLNGEPYLPSPDKEPGEKLRVGIRWAGNPQFEHEQHRAFDPQPLFDLHGVELVSLQRDSTDNVPAGIEQPDLSNWELTGKTIGSLDLVITSCTSVAHLSAAMGKPTWVIVPILPYYLWALPGGCSPWYKSVRLFRQSVRGRWDDVFINVAQALASRVQSGK